MVQGLADLADFLHSDGKKIIGYTPKMMRMGDLLVKRARALLVNLSQGGGVDELLRCSCGAVCGAPLLKKFHQVPTVRENPEWLA